jgi:hypothetical protein
MDIEILAVHHMPSAAKERMGKLDTMAIFRVNNKRNDVVIIPEDTDDPKVIQQKITERMKGRGQPVGHKFTL